MNEHLTLQQLSKMREIMGERLDLLVSASGVLLPIALALHSD
jgi:hypothetical protein